MAAPYNAAMLDWNTLDTVLLDMDGTLLDLHFDNHFWLHHLPTRFAAINGITVAEAKDDLYARFKSREGTLNWYCVDFWSAELGVDVVLLKQEVEHLIALHPHVLDFLAAVRRQGKRLVLVTNAHGKTLALKFKHTRLGEHFDQVISAHSLGLPKEHPPFWDKLQGIAPFPPARTLLIDDSLPVLRSAQHYGIRHLLAVRQPDSKGPFKDGGDFRYLGSFRDIMPR